MNADLLRESDECLSLVEDELLADGAIAPPPLLDRLEGLAADAGVRLPAPPADLKGAHEYVFTVQAHLLPPSDDLLAAPAPRLRREPLTRRSARPVFGSLAWLLSQRGTRVQVLDPGWAFEVWREAADLACLRPTRARVSAARDAWAYYWALTGELVRLAEEVAA